MLCAPTMQKRTSRVKCAAMAFQRCGAHIKAPKTNRATRRTTHRMLWSCRPHTRVPRASVRDIKQTQKHNATTTATVAIRARRSPQLPTCTQRAQSKLLRVHWMRRSTVSSDAPAARNMQLTSVLGANWLARTNQRWCHPLGKNTVHFPHHLDFFALSSAGARRQARTRAILCGLVATKPSTSITPSRPTRLSTRWSQKNTNTQTTMTFKSSLPTCPKQTEKQAPCMTLWPPPFTLPSRCDEMSANCGQRSMSGALCAICLSTAGIDAFHVTTSSTKNHSKGQLRQYQER